MNNTIWHVRKLTGTTDSSLCIQHAIIITLHQTPASSPVQ
eukprot:COSAG06_NODE_438_length_15766_cov_6.128997_4_plen_40_part_00